MQIPNHHPNVIPVAASSTPPSRRTTGTSENSSTASGTSSSSSSSTSSASITANDFLELLVTEMKNQDPTSTTDPNEYINQLVQVNSLEQLIQINQDLGGLASGTSGTANASIATPGNLSAGTSNPSLEAAASQIATAMEPRQNPAAGQATTQLSNRLPSNFLQGSTLQ